jgi:hypothetical protein
MDKQIYHAFIHKDLSGGVTSFTQDINCPFTPTKMKCNYICYYNGGIETGQSFIASPQLIRNDATAVLGVFVDSGSPVLCCTEFQVDYQVRGTFSFQVLDINLALDSSRGGTIVIDLQFSN